MPIQSGRLEEEAYPNCYLQRKNTWYNPGDKVTVGPAWRMDNRYYADGHEGEYTVVCCESTGLYRLAKGDWNTADLDREDYDLVVNVSRLTKR